MGIIKIITVAQLLLILLVLFLFLFYRISYVFILCTVHTLKVLSGNSTVVK